MFTCYVSCYYFSLYMGVMSLFFHCFQCRFHHLIQIIFALWICEHNFCMSYFEDTINGRVSSLFWTPLYYRNQTLMNPYNIRVNVYIFQCLLDLRNITHVIATVSDFIIDIYIIFKWNKTSETSNILLPTCASSACTRQYTTPTLLTTLVASVKFA